MAQGNADLDLLLYVHHALLFVLTVVPSGLQNSLSLVPQFCTAHFTRMSGRANILLISTETIHTIVVRLGTPKYRIPICF